MVACGRVWSHLKARAGAEDQYASIFVLVEKETFRRAKSERNTHVASSVSHSSSANGIGGGADRTAAAESGLVLALKGPTGGLGGLGAVRQGHVRPAW